MASLEWIKGRPYVRWQQNRKSHRRRIPDSITKSEMGKFVQKFNLANEAERWEMLGCLLDPDLNSEKTFEQLLVLYLDSCEVTQQPRTIRDKRERFNLHWLPKFGKKPLSQIQYQDIERWIHNRRKITKNKKRISETTIHNDLKVLKSFVNWCIRRGHFDGKNPVETLPKPNEPDVYYLTATEAERFLCHCTPAYYPIAATFILTGIRKGELYSLQWADIDLENRLLHVRPEYSYKNTRGRSVPIRSDLLEIFSNLPRTSKYVFPGLSGKRKTCNNLHKKARERAGFVSLRIHDLRHTFAALLISAGYDISTVSALMGHSSDRVTRRIYFRMYPDHARVVIEGHPVKLPKLVTRPKSRTKQKGATA